MVFSEEYTQYGITDMFLGIVRQLTVHTSRYLESGSVSTQKTGIRNNSHVVVLTRSGQGPEAIQVGGVPMASNNNGKH